MRGNGEVSNTTIMSRLDDHGQRISRLEGKIGGLATAASVAALAETVNQGIQANSRQHAEIKESFERCLGDAPTSLKSQIIEMQGHSKWLLGWIAAASLILGAILTFLIGNWKEIAQFFHWWASGQH